MQKAKRCLCSLYTSKIIATQSITKYRILALGLGPQHRAAGNLMAPDDNLTLTDASKRRAARPPLGIINKVHQLDNHPPGPTGYWNGFCRTRIHSKLHAKERVGAPIKATGYGYNYDHFNDRAANQAKQPIQ